MTAKRRYDKQLYFRRQAVGPLIVDTARAAAHIDRCLKWGVGIVAFDEVGVSNAGAIHRGELGRIHQRTEARILSFRPQPGVNCWPSFSARRRLQALLRLGHEQAALAAEIGVAESYMSMLVNGARGWKTLTPTVWCAIADMYESRSMTPGSSNRSRLRGEKNGWPPPLAYNNIDDPNEQPKHTQRAPRDLAQLQLRLDMAVVWRLVDEGARARQLTGAEAREAYRILVGRGLTTHEIEKRYGLNSERYGKDAA